MATRSLFADTGYFIALLSQSDALHEKALKLAKALAAKRVELVTTEAVLIETLDGFARYRYRSIAAMLIRELENDSDVEIMTTTTARFKAALELYNDRIDKTWGMTDCISFVVMREKRIKQALTADRHFVQAGFEVLL